MDSGCRVGSAKEIALSVGRSLFAFDGELGGLEGCFPHRPVFGGGGKATPVRLLFWEAAGREEGG